MDTIIGRNPVIEAIKNDREIDTVFVKSNANDDRLKYIISLAKSKKILTKEVNVKKLESLSNGENHQGVVALINSFKYYEFEELIKDIEENRKKNIKNLVVLLDKIEDVHNLGAIIRSAYLAGAQAVIIQNRNSAQVTSTVEKTSAGATSYMKICRVSNLNDSIEKLKKSGMWIYALDMGNNNYYDTDLTGDVVLVIGNEGRGVSKLVKKNSDFIISIPIQGRVDSLNASVAASIVIFDVVRQRNIKK